MRKEGEGADWVPPQPPAQRFAAFGLQPMVQTVNQLPVQAACLDAVSKREVLKGSELTWRKLFLNCSWGMEQLVVLSRILLLR